MFSPKTFNDDTKNILFFLTNVFGIFSLWLLLIAIIMELKLDTSYKADYEDFSVTSSTMGLPNT